MLEVKLTPEKFRERQQEFDEALRERARQIKVMKDELHWSFEEIGTYFGIKRQAASKIYRSFKEDDKQ